MPQDEGTVVREIASAVEEKATKKSSLGKVLAVITIIVIVIAIAFLLSLPPPEPPPPPPPEPSCTNGIQDGTEEGIDCGGTCFAECAPKDDPTYSAPSSVYDVAVDSEDRIYVADKERDRILIYSPELKYLKNIGETNVLAGGSSNQQFANPLAVAISPIDGKIYVSDRFNQRIQVFDSGLNYLKTLRESTFKIHGRFPDLTVSKDNRPIALSEPSGELYLLGESAIAGTIRGLLSPLGCHATPDGKIFVADSKNHVVKVFDSSLKQIATIGSGKGIGNTQFSWPAGVATDSKGRIFVADSENKRVQVFNADFSFKESITSGLVKPTKLAFDSKNRLIVADTGANKVRVFDQTLSSAGSINGIGWESYGALHFMPRYVAVGPDGKIFVSSEANQRLVVLGNDFTYIRELGGQRGSGNYQFFNPRDLTVDSEGNIYVADKDNHRVQVFDSDFAYVMTLGSGRGSGNGEFDDPRSVAVDSTGRIFVVDKGNERVQIFDSDSAYLDQFNPNPREIPEGSVPSSPAYRFYEPVPITIDSEDNIYVGNSKLPTVVMFDKSLEYVKTINVGSDIVEMEGGLAVDSQGRLIIVDIEGMKVRMINLETGETVKSIGGYGSGAGRFNWPSGLAITQDGKILVVDEGNYRIQVFDSELNHLETINGGQDDQIETKV